MKRCLPDECLRPFPCSMVAMGSALGIRNKRDIRAITPYGLHDDGYLSLDMMNKYIREHLPVVKKEQFRRGERPCLRDYLNNGFEGKAIICVKGHYIYAKNKRYYSFLYNGDDEVICVWKLRR